MATTLFMATATLYATAGALYLVHLSRGGEKLERWARLGLGTAVLLHVAFLASDFLSSGHAPAGNIQQTLGVLSLLISAGYLIQMRRWRLPGLGAFISPIALLFFLGAGLRESAPRMPLGLHRAVLYLHIGSSMLGTVLFALAFTVALGYLIQDRLLRSRRIGGLFNRLPALDVLDEMGLRLVTLGFPLFTLGIVAGSVWAVQLRAGALLLSAPHGFAALAWLFFAGVLLARVTMGWRGRRAAIGTILGFSCAAITLLGYLLRSAGGM
jgi:ABC-type uncharacterized transport system permease subunit